jgi:hypothetical protein
VVEVRTLGHGLHPVVERVQARSVAALTVKLEALAGRLLRRARLRASFAADGVAGWVEGTTRRILATVGKEPEWAIPLLEERGTVDIWFAPEPGSIHARIRWCEGVLKTDFSNPAFRCDLIGDEHTVFRLLPAKTLAARIGRPLGTLTKDQFIPPETIVFDARREDNGWTRLTLAIPKTPIPIGRPRGRPGGR